MIKSHAAGPEKQRYFSKLGQNPGIRNQWLTAEIQTDTPRSSLTFEDWLGDQLDAAMKQAAESSKVASNSWGAGYDTGFADALQIIFAQLPANVAKCEVPHPA